MLALRPATTVRLILGDQLNHQHSWFEQVDGSTLYCFFEARSETDYARHHIQKVVAIFLGMRHFAQHLEERGHRVLYLRLDDEANAGSIPANLLQVVQLAGANRVEYQLPDEYRLDQALEQLGQQIPAGVRLAHTDTEHFLTSRYELKEFFADKRRYTMEYFYRDMRKRLDILMEADGEPEGGAWNYDQENRKKLPKGVRVPDPIAFDHAIDEVVQLLARCGVVTMGRIDAQAWEWPVTRAEALRALEDFVRMRLRLFGTYQDAMTTRDPYLFHARISFALNSKLISPAEVVEAVTRYYRAHPDQVEINQIEGFVRQVIGWREYMRGIYWAHMPGFAEMNVLEHIGELPAWYWDANTKLNCLKHALGQSLDKAYAHHIQRLMIIGNFALLMGVHPDEVDAWYLGVYIDAFEWVEITNVRGMSQFADGGIVATKPYMSSANYIHKMSDYCVGCYYDRKLRHGPRACPYNSLYWAFVERHRKRLARNGRIAQMVRLWDRMEAAEQEATLAQAAYYMEHRHEL